MTTNHTIWSCRIFSGSSKSCKLTFLCLTLFCLTCSQVISILQNPVKLILGGFCFFVMWRKTVNQYHQFMWRQPLKKIAVERKRQLWRGTYMLPFNLLNSFYCKLISANNLCKMRNFMSFKLTDQLIFYCSTSRQPK